MSELKNLVPPPELCKLIPEGEFEDSALVYIDAAGWRVCFRSELIEKCHNDKTPAPTLEEILDELHKCQEDVFIKWSNTAYHGWFVNAYTHDKEDYQAHDKSGATAALKVWLKMKGIEA